MSTLYLVSTPIGNLGDLSRRASETLAQADRVLAEDTRRTRKLLSHLGISVPLVSLHAHNEVARTEAVLGWLEAGETLALVSDAGTPLVSDPGARLVEAVLAAGHGVTPVPGASAVLAALVASGFAADRFSFMGFLPRKGPEREALLERLEGARETVVLFESPERVEELLGHLADRCRPERRVAVARELTKLHEEFVRGTLCDVRSRLEAIPPRGEVTVVLEGDSGREEGVVEEAAGEAARVLAAALLAHGLSPSQAAREVARRLRLPRNLAYRSVQELIRDPEAGA